MSVTLKPIHSHEHVDENHQTGKSKCILSTNLETVTMEPFFFNWINLYATRQLLHLRAMPGLLTEMDEPNINLDIADQPDLYTTIDHIPVPGSAALLLLDELFHTQHLYMEYPDSYDKFVTALHGTTGGYYAFRRRFIKNGKTGKEQFYDNVYKRLNSAEKKLMALWESGKYD